MVNPFKHVATNVADYYREAAGSDCAPGPAKVGVTLILPVAVPALFIAALFKKAS